MINTSDKSYQLANKLIHLKARKRENIYSILNSIALLCRKPIVVVKILDDKYSHLIFRKGIRIRRIPLSDSFCRLTAEKKSFLEIADTSKDVRVKDYASVKGYMHIRYYCGRPITIDGETIGGILLFDTAPNGKLNSFQKKAFQTLAGLVTTMLQDELLYENIFDQLRVAQESHTATAQLLNRFTGYCSHELRRPVANILGLFYLAEPAGRMDDETWLLLKGEVEGLDKKIRQMVTIAEEASPILAKKVSNLPPAKSEV